MLSIVIIILVAIPVAYHVLSASRGGKHYPPGPKGLPLLGNIFDIPIDAAHITFAKWCWTKYGGIMYLRVLQKSLVVINSYPVARDLLEQKSALYACRPRVPMAGDVIGWSFTLPLVPYNETFKRQRKYLQTYFGKQRLPNYYDLQKKQAYRLINAVFDTPDLFNEHMHRVPAATIISIVYGHDAKTLDDWMLKEIADGTKTLLATGAPGAHIVDLLPFLRHVPDWLPGANFKRLPPGTRESMHRMLYSPYNFVRKQMNAGTAVPCYVSTMLEMTNHEDEKGIVDTAATLYAAAFDTTIAVMMTALMLLTKYPHVQVKLQQEFDTVVGRDRLPDFSDSDSLPYFHCVLEETLRFCSAISMGVPHRNTEDDVYNGMFIPKGTTVLANIWAMLHDPDVYPNPEVFDPDRFMTGPGHTPAPSTHRIVFGFGRRHCPGEDFAMNSVFITIAILFHVFSFSQKMDDKGDLIPIDDRLTETTVRHPMPFVCDIKPRWPEAGSLILAVREDDVVSTGETK